MIAYLYGIDTKEAERYIAEGERLMAKRRTQVHRSEYPNCGQAK